MIRTCRTLTHWTKRGSLKMGWFQCPIVDTTIKLMLGPSMHYFEVSYFLKLWVCLRVYYYSKLWVFSIVYYSSKLNIHTKKSFNHWDYKMKKGHSSILGSLSSQAPNTTCTHWSWKIWRTLKRFTSQAPRQR